jgi:hypothetical protein
MKPRAIAMLRIESGGAEDLKPIYINLSGSLKMNVIFDSSRPFLLAEKLVP